ncbi:pentapeptide repeat-containing protein [Rothia mucilaginosa]|uniref:pentapeptide repeat-containing protein n=1 Tax=Rothia mucilaginosa TaxID=43675 RepID=UPI003CF781EB
MPSNNASSIPESQVLPRAQENPWYIQHFIKLLIGFGLGGGAVAILLPWMLWLLCGMSSGSSDQLRLHLLYITGGIIAVLTLLQTNWKNQGDRLKIDADIKKNEQDAEKNERDHIRQVHTERRSRYTKAVEQLADEKATVRLGGIYTLVGLVDEWLADDALNPEERQKEGQVIINNLCSYIRSPFPLARKAEMFEGDSEPDNYEGDFSKDQAAFHEEQDVRRTIFVEMSKRSSTFTRDEIRTVIDTFPGMWSEFEFDFSRAPIFYPLNAVTIEKGNFSGARFYTDANFVEATFTSNADFRAATFAQTANFNWATFTQTANFNWATFTQTADFSEATFAQTANFIRATFTQNADISGATFTQTANFNWAIFTQNAYFSGATFTQTANFIRATFTQTANFSWATFTQNADFSEATFTQNARFIRATFTQNAHFRGATFEKYSPLFVTTGDKSGKTYRARFAVLSDTQGEHEFTVRVGSKLIEHGKATLRGKPFIIPVGTVLFDWDNEIQGYITSEPAEPLDNSSAGEENITE